MRSVLSILFILLTIAVSAQEDEPVMVTVLTSQGDTELDMGQPRTFHLRTNLLYDVALLPNVGVEFSIGERWTMAANGTFNWLSNDNKHRYWRMASVDAEVRYWLGGRLNAYLLKGHHIGIYGAVYRYDIEFGGKGQMGDFNYGGGFSYGYSTPISRRLSLDFTIGVGYIGGRYKEYEPSRDTWNHYVVLEEKNRQWVGPTKAEVTLVWHLGSGRRQKPQPGNREKGGAAWW